jgi:hypothetical protein
VYVIAGKHGDRIALAIALQKVCGNWKAAKRRDRFMWYWSRHNITADNDVVDASLGDIGENGLEGR